MKKALFIIFILSLAMLLTAESSTAYGFKFININTTPVVAGQGGVGAFSSPDAYSFLQNPAAPLFNRNRVVSASQNLWIFGTVLNNLGYSYSTGSKAFGLAFRYLDYGKIDAKDDGANDIGEFHPMDLGITVNYGYRITPDHYAGINLNALYKKIDVHSSLAFTLDLGYTYITPIKGLKIAAALKNITNEEFNTKMDQEDIMIPLGGEISLVKDFDLNFAELSSELKVFKYEGDEEAKGIIGFNAFFNERLYLRMGYKINYDAEKISAGFGVVIKKIMVDYSYSSFDVDAEDIHVIGLSYRF